MSEPTETPLPSWGDVTAALGFGVLCVQEVDAERFTFMLTDRAKIQEQGFSSIGTLMSEHDVRAQLQLVGFSDVDIERAIGIARMWKTFTTRWRGFPTRFLP